MFLRRTIAQAPVNPGAVFRRMRADRTVETASVVAVLKDCAGIPHVRFLLHVDRAETADEQRTLALGVFAKLFSERVGA